MKNKNNLVKPTLVLVELLACFISVVLPFSVQAVFWKTATSSTSNLVEVQTVEVVNTNPLFDVAVLSAVVNPDPNSARGGDEVVAVDGALVSTGPVGRDEITASHKNSGEISTYVVREGDSLSQIAEMFNVTANTILWANDLTSAKSIQPGDTLVILPMIGVRHVVKAGDTIASIAKKYDGDIDEILAFNQLNSATDIVVGATLMIPGGEIHSAPVTNNSSVKSSTTNTKVKVSSSGLSHPLPGATRTQGIHGYNGVDLSAPVGSSIKAAAGGEVIISKSSGWNGGYGNYIVIKHRNGTQTLYAHLSHNNVGVGDTVTTGQVIGVIGSTGKSTGTHLHFEVRGAKNPF